MPEKKIIKTKPAKADKPVKVAKPAKTSSDKPKAPRKVAAKKTDAERKCKGRKLSDCAAPCAWTRGLGCGDLTRKSATPKAPTPKAATPKVPTPYKSAISSNSAGTSPMQQTDKYMAKIHELAQHIDMLTLIGKDLVEENNQLRDDVQKLWKKLKDCNDEVPYKEAYPDLSRYKKRTWAGYFKSFVVKGAK